MGHAWVYALPRTEITRVLQALVGIEHISIEDRGAVLVALDGFAQGLDFADALHLARSSRDTAFLTFDRRLAKRANAVTMTPPVELLA
jgi:predicted nucleic-acid-binding protein